jgi:RNA recognition motif-containing protein
MEIFVRNLSKEVEETDLSKVFSQYGTVELVTLVKDKETGRRMDFGFVSMPIKDEAVTAINALSGVDLKGRPIEVQDSRARFERRQVQERRGSFRASSDRRQSDRRQSLPGSS